MPATLVDLILDGASQSDRIAHRYRTGVRRLEFSFQETIQHALTVAALLETQGVKPGDHVMLWAPSSPAWVWSFFGIILAGGVVVPADMRAQNEVIADIAQRAKVTLLIQTGLKPELPGIPSLLIEDLFTTILAGAHRTPAARNTPAPDDLVELLYTSGTTGAPKGVILTHRNILSNLFALEKVITISPEQSAVSVLPLSHIFEQVVGFLTFWQHGASVTYLRTIKPSELLEAIAEERPTNLLLVPRLLGLLRARIEHEFKDRHLGPMFSALVRLAPAVPRGLRRVLFLPIHRKFGFGFQYFVVGGAPFPDDLQAFWDRLGFTVVQGYGLTETSPILACNLPSEQRLGSVGRPLPEQELRCALDGEVLARGPHVFSGYYEDPEKTGEVFTDGWFKTGDVGELKDGWLYLKGRKKDVIVPAHGMNVHAEDVEQALLRISGVKDVAVIGKKGISGEEVHAVLLLNPGAPAPEEIVRSANALLDSTQQIQGFTIWSQEDFPRTATLKIRKFLVAQEIAKMGHQQAPVGPEATNRTPRLYELIATATGHPLAEVRPGAVLSRDLGLDSVGRLELISLLESELAADIEESDITADTTVVDLESRIAHAPLARERFFWRWPFSAMFLPVQWLLRRLIAFPLLCVWVRFAVEGQEQLQNLQGPVLFVSNHVSAIDTLVILRALPRHLKRRVAVFARLDLFEHQTVLRALCWRFIFFLFSLFVPIVVVPQDRGFRRTLKFAGRVVDRGTSLILYPEGERTRDGRIQPFRIGAGLAAQELLLHVIPLRLFGLFELLPRHSKWPRHGRVRVKFGTPFRVSATSPVASARELQRAVTTLQ